jgi:hypothetical protein
MLVTVQFPLADMRLFARGSERRLPKPAWPDAHPGGEFVRGIGGVDFRRLGGLNGWIGEGTHCRASRLILLDKMPALSILNQVDYPFVDAIRTRIAFRRLFADGQALVKCEIGLASSSIFRDWGIQYDLLKAIDNILTLQCRVPGRASGPLLFSGKSLATRYLECTTNRSVGDTADPQIENGSEMDLIAAGDPLVFVDLTSSTRISLPKGYTSVVMPGNFAFQLFYGHYAKGSLRVPIWFLLHPIHENPSDKNARHLRIYLQRIHAEKEVLRLILNNIASGKLESGSSTSESLQRYFLESTSRIGHLEHKADKRAADGIGALAASCLEFVQPGWLNTLTRRLDLMNIRPNVRRNIEARVRRKGSLVNYGVILVNVDQSDKRRGTFMSDTFSNITNSTIVNRSLVEHAFNRTKSELGEDTATILLKIAELVAQSNNKEAGELLDQFNEELGKPEPRKSLLKRSWDGLMTILPAVSSIAGAAAAIAKLLV